MLSRILSSAVVGIDALEVEVEVDVARGLPAFTTVGLPDNAVKESKDRVRSAVKNSGYGFPTGRITVNLAPAELKKEGAAFDLPVALGILSAEAIIKSEDLLDYIVLGELSLDGRVKAVRGALPVAVAARKLGKKIILPSANAEEAALVDGLQVYGVETLSEVVEFLNGTTDIAATSVDTEAFFKQDARALSSDASGADFVDLSEVRGQEHVKRALEVAAAGGHNMLMVGPPGSGKTMLAKRIPTILPEMTLNEAIEATKVHSVAGTLPDGASLVTMRPYRSPHHTISDAGLIGGGQIPRPGEVSLAHNGVLFLDEVAEFRKNVLEVLRQPLEDGVVTISRAAISITYPSDFMLICAMNPCPCGFMGDTRKDCDCTPMIVKRYRSKLSGPLLDRIDIHVDVPRVRFNELSSDRSGESSFDVKKRVDRARALQKERFKKLKIFSNAAMASRHIKKFCVLDDASKALLEKAVERLGLSARAYTRILKVARTIADLEGAADISASHLSEAIQYRTFDRQVA